MTLKSLTITIHRHSRHCSIINIGPLASRHLYLNNLEVITQPRKSLTIFTFGQTKCTSSLTTKRTRLLRRSVNRLQPLCGQRNRLLRTHILQVFNNLITQILPHSRFDRSANKLIKVISTTHLHDIIKVLDNSLRSDICQILQNDTSSTALTTSTANITGHKHSLQRIQRVLIPSLLKKTQNISFTTSAQRTRNRIKIKQTIPSGRASNCTILGQLRRTIKRSFIGNSIYKLIHIFFLSLEELKTLNNKIRQCRINGA